MNKLTYGDWHDMDYFMEKYGDLTNWSSFESRKEEIRKVNPRLIQLNEDIIRMRQDLDDKIRTFNHELEDTPMEED